jgi:hypothetical protein
LPSIGPSGAFVCAVDLRLQGGWRGVRGALHPVFAQTTSLRDAEVQRWHGSTLRDGWPESARQDDGSDARWEQRDGQTCHGPEPCGPDVGQQAHCDPAQTTTDAIVTRTTIQHLGGIRRGGAVVAREVRRHVHARGHSVETELVALDVLHHEARLVVAIGKQ